ncbi:MAG: 3-deoxy-D-manno-octulosonic acid transferase [Bacteroidota bacterium]
MNILWPLYYLGIQLYKLLIKIAAPFNKKAHAWLHGRRALAPQWKKLKSLEESRIWVHCASLGEFEQGKPLILALKEAYPNYKIVLTFFSPSGYEIRKNTPLVDYVFYMPLDGPRAAKRFVKAINPKMVFFVKYEFWYFYGRYLSKKKIPFFCVSAIFRPDQIFFKWYGGFFKQMLMRYTHIFVQDQASLRLLYKHAIAKVTVAGDTRFDAVFKIANEHQGLFEIEKFKRDKKLIVFGSIWNADRSVMDEWIIKAGGNFKFIVAPHEIKEEELKSIEAKHANQTVRYSEWIKSSNSNYSILIIDNVGLLSQIYKYANYVYIGGGFGVGIHNVLEAAVYGMPIFFGPNYKKFNEAVELVKQGGAFSVKSNEQLLSHFNQLEHDEDAYKTVCEGNKRYVESRKGATQIIIDYLKINSIS